jgi:hypothetical protein
MFDAFGFGTKVRPKRDPNTMSLGLDMDIKASDRIPSRIKSGKNVNMNGKSFPGSIQNPDYIPYSIENPWRYDRSINLNSSDKVQEAKDYISNSWDNTEFESEFTNAFVKKYGLEKWKEAVDGIINAHNPMNAYDTEGNEMNVFGSGDATDFIEERFPIFQELYGDK